jgi:formate hydrogenlyase subunit 4
MFMRARLQTPKGPSLLVHVIQYVKFQGHEIGHAAESTSKWIYKFAQSFQKGHCVQCTEYTTGTNNILDP